MKYYSLLAWLSAGMILGSGCEMISPSQEIPTYVRIDSFAFQAQGDVFGTSSHRLSSVWVYLDNQPLGAYELPAMVPVLHDKAGLITVAPGVSFNGLIDFQVPYPFYKFDSLQLDRSPGEIVNFAAETGYTPDTRVAYNATFDMGSHFMLLSGDASVERTVDPQYVKEGGGAGLVRLDGSGKRSESISQEPFAPAFAQSVFLELDYKATLPFQVGVVAFFPNGTQKVEYISGVNPRAEWNKIYISLQEFVNGNQNGVFHLIIRTATENGEPSGWVAIDNAKIVTF